MNRTVVAVLVLGSTLLAACGAKSEKEVTSSSATAEAPPRASSSVSASPPPPPPPPTSASYTLHAEGRDQPNFWIEKVTIDAKETTVDLTFENRSARQTWIAVHPKGAEKALFIEAAGKKYALLRATNIAEHPKRDFLAPKEKRTFTLVFEPLPIDTRVLDVFEGEAARSPPAVKGTIWAFLAVQLDAQREPAKGALPAP